MLNSIQEEADCQNSEILDLSIKSCPAEEVYRYFPNFHRNLPNPLIDQLFNIQRNLNQYLNTINFLNLDPNIKYVYNPTEYAAEPCELYIKKYCRSPKKLLFVGMNPGPYGMCQTGVPFGDTNWVKNWLHIEGKVQKPPKECPLKPVKGFRSTRKEQSGNRFWKFVSDLCGTPEKFFANSFVYNYCPLAFLDDKGRNLTPMDIKECKALELICDKFYWDVINLLNPEILIAIGRYIERRTKVVLKAANSNIPLIFLKHPSFRSPNNRNWPEEARKMVEDNNLIRFFQ